MMSQNSRLAIAGRETIFKTLGYLWISGALMISMPLSAVESSVDSEIQALLGEVAKSGCDFRRNGSMHKSSDAAEHLALKYSRGKRYVKTTENFIDRLASKSSWTGRSYSVICDGVETASSVWLHAKLVELRKSTPNTRVQ